MRGADVAVLRALVGLSAHDLAPAVGVSLRTVRRWEAGEADPAPPVVEALRELRAAHDADTAVARREAAEGALVAVPRDVHGARPGSWWRAVAARVMAAEPGARFAWGADLSTRETEAELEAMRRARDVARAARRAEAEAWRRGREP